MLKTKRDPLRRLAKSFKYQSLYARASELGSIQIFENTSDFSKIQLEFLYWLGLYHRLYQDLAMEEKYLTEETIADDLLCDCYLIWEHRVKHKEELERIRNPHSKKCDRQPDNNSTIPSVVFRKG